MREAPTDVQMEVYSEAAKSGLYAKPSGLVGKYDNVRRYWEDEVTRWGLYPHIEALLRRARSKGRGLRIMDLGCGSGDGYELLTGIRQRDANLRDLDVALLGEDALEAYKGVDLNEDLLEQAGDLYGGTGHMVFDQADFTRGLPLSQDEKPYDLYLTSYGAASHHNDDETLIALLAEIAERTEDHAVIVCDWIGRHSYEWQSLWTVEPSERPTMDYVVSYIFDEDERQARRDEWQHLTLRLMSRAEAERILAAASRRAGVEIKALSFFDRSIFAGRHMDTGDYNRHAQPIRRGINSLLESGERTSLRSLELDYVPRAGFDSLNEYFERVAACWNVLVHYVEELLAAYDPQGKSFRASLPPVSGGYPAALRRKMAHMRLVVQRVGWLNTCLPRENIIEPQLAYVLRSMVTELQEGQGCAHGLVGVFEVNKS